MALALALTLGASMLTGSIYAVSRHTGVLDGIFPNEHYLPQDGASAGDLADGMPDDQREDRFGGDADRQDHAADGGASEGATPVVKSGVSVWMVVLALSLAATAIVVGVIYLRPYKKGRKE